MTQEYDSPWKEAIHRFFPKFLEFFFPNIATELDWSRGYTNKDKDLLKITRTAKLGKREADCLMQVTRSDGEIQLVLIHVEVQNQRDPDFAKRMYIYHYRIADFYQMPVCSLAILGDKHPDWRPSTHHQGVWNCGLLFWFPVAKLEDRRSRLEQLETEPNPFGPLVAAHLQSHNGGPASDLRREVKFRMLRRLFARGLSNDEVRTLVHLVDWILHLSPKQSRLFLGQMEQYEQEQDMAYINTFERAGWERGLEAGRDEGLKRHLETMRATVRNILSARFGSVPDEVTKGLEAVKDMERLSQLAVLAAERESLGDFGEALKGL